MKNILYFARINIIGGGETFFYYLAKKYQDLDITIFYKEGDAKQIERLRQYIRVKKYNGEKIKCKKAFFNYNLDIIDNVEADEYIQIIHGDYKAIGLAPNQHPKITKYLGVSQLVCDTFKEITGHDVELCYNPIMIDKPKKVLNLISATRLTNGKGKPRMIKLANMLDEAKIPYVWTVFTNDNNIIDNPNIVYAKPRLDIINHIANADYLVQLSNTEAYCYSVVESLTVGTPVIVTDCPVYKEIGVQNKVNGFVVGFDMKNVPIKEIYKGLPKFTYTPFEDNWDKIFAKGESQYKKDLATTVKVRPLMPYFDLQLKRTVTPNDEFEVNKIRAETLIDMELVKEV